MAESEATIGVQEELEAIRPLVEQITGLSSRWSGVVHLVPEAPFRGLKPFHCDILLAEDIAFSPTRWRTLIHELLHSVSRGYNSTDYNAAQGFEEGVVEALQRRIRQRILLSLGVEIEATAFEEGDHLHVFNGYITALEDIRSTLGQNADNFYLELIRTPIRERYALLMAQALQMPTESRKQAIMTLSTARSVLEEHVR